MRFIEETILLYGRLELMVKLWLHSIIVVSFRLLIIRINYKRNEFATIQPSGIRFGRINSTPVFDSPALLLVLFD